MKLLYAGGAPGVSQLVKVAESSIKAQARRYGRELQDQVKRAARLWRTESKVKLSQPCAASAGRVNPTGYPGRCSGDLERSLHYRTYARIRGTFPNYSVYSGVEAQFVPFKNAEGVDYGQKLNTEHPKLLGYKERIYKALQDKIAKAIRSHDFKPFL